MLSSASLPFDSTRLNWHPDHGDDRVALMTANAAGSEVARPPDETPETVLVLMRMVAGNGIAKFSIVAVVAFGLGGCASDEETPDLPAGWEDAERVTNLIQHDCAGSAIEEHDERAAFVPSDGSLDVRYEDAHFRCEQDVEGFYKDSGDALDILVQPVEMHPSSPTRCDCLYEITFTVAPLAGSRQATLFKRWDDLNEPNDPVEIASEPVVVE